MKCSVLEINLNKFYNNIQKIQKEVGNKQMIPVIKANAYGTYINKNLKILNKFPIVAVAEVQEAVEVRKTGYLKEIFVLNQPSIEELNDIYNYQITIGLSDIHFLKQVNIPITVHLEIETGMNRTGIKLEDLEDFIEEVKKKKIVTVEGIYTHFSSADNDLDYTEKQFQIFRQAVEITKNHFDLKYIHSSASNGILNYPEDYTNAVRPGILLYGYEPFKGAKEKIDVEPIATLKTRINYIKNLEAKEAISYNQRFISHQPMKVATIPIGYADGLRRALTGSGEVFIKGQKRKILGTICMDSCMIDVTDLDVKIGDTVYIWNNQDITLEEIADKCNTINYEILSTISPRVERVLIEKKK